MIITFEKAKVEQESKRVMNVERKECHHFDGTPALSGNCAIEESEKAARFVQTKRRHFNHLKEMVLNPGGNGLTPDMPCLPFQV